MNKNYQSGRNFEYKTKRIWEEKGYLCLRSAGSHGPFDVVAIPIDRPERPVVLIQCKRVKTRAEWERLRKDFKAKPPLDTPPKSVVMLLSCYISDERTTEDTWL